MKFNEKIMKIGSVLQEIQELKVTIPHAITGGFEDVSGNVS